MYGWQLTTTSQPANTPNAKGLNAKGAKSEKERGLMVGPPQSIFSGVTGERREGCIPHLLSFLAAPLSYILDSSCSYCYCEEVE
jgi:hypothetical protein